MDTAFTGAFAVAWNSFVAVWTVSALASGEVGAFGDIMICNNSRLITPLFVM